MDPAALSILAGAVDLTAAGGGVRINIGGYEIHEDYNEAGDFSLTHDIALIEASDGGVDHRPSALRLAHTHLARETPT